jgi:uncharacterized protein involved in outer membrane biogenesis
MAPDSAPRPGWPRRLLRRATTLPFLITAGVLAVLAVAYTLAGFLLVPRLVKTYAPRYVQEQLARRAEIGEVRFNPLLFKFEIEHFRLQEADGRPILGFDRLFVDFELTSLFRKAWTVAKVELDAPRLDASLAQNGRVNIADLLDAFPKGEPSSEPPPRVLLEHAVVRRGTVSFTDLTGRQPQTAVVDPIDVELRHITTVPEDRGPYVIAATLNGGGVVGWEGEVSLVPLRSTGRLGLKGFPLATAWRFVQEDVTVAEPAGALDAEVRYQLAYLDGSTTLKVEGIEVGVTGLALTQRGDAAPLLAFEKIRLAGGFGDLIAREVTVPEILMTRGRVAAAMGKDGVLNWQKLMVAPPASTGAAPPAPPAAAEAATAASKAVSPAAPPDARPWRLALDKIRVEQVALSFTDLRHAAPLDAGVRDLAVDLSAKLEHGPAGLGGKVEGLGVAVTGLAVAQRGDKAPLLALDQFRLAGGRADLGAREVAVSEISLSRGRLAAIMARHGVMNWQILMAPPAGAATAPNTPAAPVAAAARPAAAPGAPRAAPPTASADTRPWRVALGKLRVEHFGLAFTDQSRATPLDVTVGDLAVGLSAKLESGPAGLAGVVDGVGVKLAKVGLQEVAAKTPLATLEQIAIEGGRIDLGRQQISASRVGVNGGGTTIVRAADGSLPLLAMLGPAEPGMPAPGPVPAPASRPAPAPASATGTARRPPPPPAARPWTVALARFDFADHRIGITDRGITPPIQIDVTDLKVSARDLRTDGAKPFPFDASFRIAQGGRFTAQGRAAPDGSTAEVTLALAQLALATAQPYVARTADVELRSGEASTAGKLTYRGGGGRAAVTYAGTVDVNGVNVVEAKTGDPVVAWKALHVDNLRFGLAPDRMEIAEVRLAGLDGKLVIFKDKTVSVAKLMKPAPAPAGGTPAPPSPPAGPPSPAPAAAPPASGTATATSGEPAPGFPVVIERVRIDDGSAHFADLSLVLPFATRIHALNGVIVGLGSDPGSRATVKLDGRVDEFGSVRVEGTLSAYQPKAFTDIAVVFRNVPMSTFTPYSATFAGRRIQSGTMNLDLQYKIERSALVGQNKVALQRLRLGERVESPGATRLPLDLAIAILSDSEGRINIDLPVRGNVDSPQFSYGAVIWQALVTVITRVATAPFRALAGAFGGDTERLQAIVFEPGSDTVPPPEREKLQKVAEMLGKRSQLKLTVHGGYEARMDGEALRSLRVRQDLAQRLEVKLKPGEDPGPVAFDQVKTQRALEAMLTQRGGDKAVADFEKGYEKSTGQKADRASAVLAIVGRGSGDRAFYEALFRRLVETAPLTDAEVKDLGKRRAEAIARALKERAAEVAARVEIGEIEAAGRAERNAIPTRLELGAAGG